MSDTEKWHECEQRKEIISCISKNYGEEYNQIYCIKYKMKHIVTE